MSFTYITGLPNPPDNPSDDVGGMQTNCNSINNWVNVDHVGFNNSLGGQHLQVTIPTPQAAPSPSGTVGEITTQVINSNSELFYTNAVENIQLTNSPLVASNGEGMLPGGLNIRSGSATASTGGVTVTFSTAFPTACLSVVATANGSGSLIFVTGVSATSFVAKTGGFANIYFVATGY